MANPSVDVHVGACRGSADVASSGGHPSRTAGWVVGGIGVAGLLVGGVAGVLTLDRKSTVDANCSEDKRCNPAGYDAAQSGQNARRRDDRRARRRRDQRRRRSLLVDWRRTGIGDGDGLAKRPGNRDGASLVALPLPASLSNEYAFRFAVQLRHSNEGSSMRRSLPVRPSAPLLPSESAGAFYAGIASTPAILVSTRPSRTAPRPLPYSTRRPTRVPRRTNFTVIARQPSRTFATR